MKKPIFVFLLFFTQLLHANESIEVLKTRVCHELPFIYGWCSEEKVL